MSEELLLSVNSVVFGVWFLMGAALVFWMQAGFAMVEAGFTRAKNTGNILMKNLMDFCIGTPMFVLIGFSLLLGEDMMGIIGKPGFDIFTSYSSFDWSNFVFNLVFCATTATIVSGAMAERTKFLSYCVYSAVISAVIYPIEAHWVWGGGWLSQLGFHDFAGSAAIHMVGGGRPAGPEPTMATRLPERWAGMRRCMSPRAKPPSPRCPVHCPSPSPERRGDRLTQGGTHPAGKLGEVVGLVQPLQGLG